MPRTYTEIYSHIIFATKHRHPYLHKPLQQALFGFLGGVVRNKGGIAIAIGGMSDHTHLLVRTRPTLALADLLKSLKGSSSRWINDQSPTDDDPCDHFGWQEGYALFSVSPSQVEKVRHYIENQELHHRNRSYDEELEWLLRKSQTGYPLDSVPSP